MYIFILKAIEEKLICSKSISQESLKKINGRKTAGEQKRSFLLFFSVCLLNTKRYIHSLQHQLFKIPASLCTSTTHVIKGKGKKAKDPYGLSSGWGVTAGREISFQTREFRLRARCSPLRTNRHERGRRRESLSSQGTGSREIK